jgi:prepilin-type N-terminal cleavage/methylation domain-containing protein
MHTLHTPPPSKPEAQARESATRVCPVLAHSTHARSAFTLVELLVVIGIIALLAALVTPAVMRAQTAARNAAIKAEIDMLHMAIMNYKNEYGSFPPGISGISSASDSAVKHLSRLFPRCNSCPAQLLAAFPSSASPKTITAANALTYWLSGYTDDPTAPLSSSGLTRNILFSFDMSRVDQTTGAYFPSGKSKSNYLYLNSSLYASNAYSGATIAGAMRQTTSGDATPFYNTGSETNDFFNPDSFQILCAGRDEEFGNDDDLSNFWPGTRKDYLDSLNK